MTFPHEKVDAIGKRQPNPVAEAYRFYQGTEYNACSWDPTALIFAVEGENPDFYTLSPAGTIEVDDAGITRFTPSAGGQHRYLLADEGQVKMLTEHLVELVTAP